MPDGIRLGGAYFELVADNTQLAGALVQAQVKAQQASAAIQAATKAQTAAIVSGSAQAQAASTQLTRAAQGAVQASVQATARYRQMAGTLQQTAATTKIASGEFAKFGLAVAGLTALAGGLVAVGAIVNNTLQATAAATQKAADLTFQLGRTYGGTAAQMRAFSEGIARDIGKSNNQVTQGVANFQVLERGYGLTRKQVLDLTKATVDLAAVTGVDTVDAFERIIGVFRDGGESAEKLGLVVNDSTVKAIASMTKEQRKNFEQLDAFQKSQIRYNELMKQAGFATGAAADKAKDASGAWGRLSAANENLATTFGSEAGGSGLVGATASAVEWLDNLIKSGNETQEALQQLKQANQGFTGGLIDLFLIPEETVRERLEQMRQLAAIGIQVGPDAGQPGSTVGGLTPQQARAASAQAAQRAEKEARDYVERRQKLLDDDVRRQERAFRRVTEARNKAIDEEIVRLNVEQEHRLKQLEVRERETLRAIEAEGDAEEKLFKAKIERFELEKRAAIDAADRAAEQAERAIEAERKRLDRERELEDRDVADARRREDNQVEDSRRKQDRAREVDHRGQLRDIDERKDAALDALKAEAEAAEDTRDRKLRALDEEVEVARDVHRDAMRRIADEADAAREAHDEIMDGLDARRDAEDDRHRIAQRNIEDEADRQNELIDAQLRLLQLQEDQEEKAKRIAKLRKDVADAEKALANARGTGDADAIRLARETLIGARRRGNPGEIEDAEAQLRKVAGEGNEAILEASKDLAEAQQELREAGVDDARDAERQRLEDAKAAIAKRVEAAKRAEDDINRTNKEGIDAQKRAADDELADALKRLEKKKRAEDDDLEEALDRIDKRKDALKDETETTLEEIKKRREATEKDFEEEKRQEDQRYEQDTIRLQNRRREEDRNREETRTEEDRVRTDRRKAEDEALAIQLQAVKDNLALERRAIEEHYNGPNGVITITQKAMEASKEAYRLRLEDARLKFKEEADLIKAVYTNSSETGLIDLQNKAKDNNNKQLDQQISDLHDWQRDATAAIEQQKGEWRSLAEAIEGVNNAIRNTPRGPQGTPVVINPNITPPSRSNDPNSTGGSGSGGTEGPPPPPPASGGVPAPEPTVDTINEVSMAANRYGRGLGYLQPYNGKYKAGPGWEGGAAWPGGPSHHKGVDLTLPGGIGSPIGSFTDGIVKYSKTSYSGDADKEPGGRYVVVQKNGKAYWYMHLKRVYKTSGYVRRGEHIADLGESGTEGYPHLHYEVRGGANGGINDGPLTLAALRRDGIDPVPSMTRGYDSGRMFNWPTYTYTPATGESAVIAERRPEVLLGGAATAARQGVGFGSGPTRAFGGALLADPATGGSVSTTYAPTFNGFGVDRLFTEFQNWMNRQERGRPRRRF